MTWTIVCSDKFEKDVDFLGGRSVIGLALETVFEGLRQNPFGFEHASLGIFSFRYAKTLRIGGVPPLVIIYSVGQGKIVTVDRVELD